MNKMHEMYFDIVKISNDYKKKRKLTNTEEGDSDNAAAGKEKEANK